MAYSELIKDFRRIREYLRDFYVFGFKLRSEFTKKSARSYDNERRRVESWMGDYVSFYQDSRGKRVFLSMDSRTIPHNPLYRAFKAKSFTAKDILLHFYLIDLFRDQETLELRHVLPLLEEYYPDAVGSFVMDEKTVRLKVRELAELGILEEEKQGRKVFFRLAREDVALDAMAEAIDFFSETMPLGVTGAYLLDKLEPRKPIFRYKHNYPMHAIDSEILGTLLEAISKRCAVEMTVLNPREGELTRVNTPLRIYISTENGREYVLVWSHTEHRYFFTRLDRITELKLLNPDPKWQQRKEDFRAVSGHLWGISLPMEALPERLHWVEMEVLFGPEEGYIRARLEREKRCAVLEELEEGRWLVRAEVFDPMEMMPWIFSFTGRIARLESSDPKVAARYEEYLRGLEDMYVGQ